MQTWIEWSACFPMERRTAVKAPKTTLERSAGWVWSGVLLEYWQLCYTHFQSTESSSWPLDLHDQPLPFSDPFQAWIDGLYELWPGSSPDVPMQTDYEPLSSPVPTITIGNIVPELSPAVGPASISIAYV